MKINSCYCSQLIFIALDQVTLLSHLFCLYLVINVLLFLGFAICASALSRLLRDMAEEFLRLHACYAIDSVFRAYENIM